MKRWIFITMLATTSAFALTPLSYEQTIEQWRTQRIEGLKKPQGWLSLVGLHWLDLKAGTQTVGRAADNAIVLSTGPDRLGELSYAESLISFTPAKDSGVTVNYVVRNGAVELKSDSTSTPTTLAFDNGEATIQLIERGEKFALRVRDARAKTRSGFVGLENYAIDPSWRIEARFEPHAAGKTIQIANVIGQLDANPNPGAVVFERDGKSYRLEAVDEGDGQLFLIFADRSNGKETYGAGRFLYADAAVDGKTVVDFNKAYNPPCAFNAYSTCPLPPPENRLDLTVTAGEKKYAGATH